MRKLLLLFLLTSFFAEAQIPRLLLRGKTKLPSPSIPSYFSNVITSQSGNVISVTFDTDVTNQNQPPSIESVTITGTAEKTETLTANIDGFKSMGGYSAGTHTYQWYRADNFQSSGAAITSATNSTYVLTAADVAKYIRVEVTPVQVGGMNNTGTAVTSIYTDQIQDDVWNPLTDITDWHNALVSPSGSEDLATNLYWRNDGNGSNSTQNGSDPIPNYDAVDEAVDFEASNNEELILDQPSTQFTGGVEVWIRVKFESFPGGFGRILSWTSNQLIEQRTDGIIYVSGVSTGYIAPLNQWIVMRFFISQSANTSEFNVNDGTEVTGLNASTSAFGTSNGMIGANSGGTGNRLDGKISHIFIKQTQLSAPDQFEMWNWFGTNAPWDNPWWLAGGLVPASVNYSVYDAIDASSQANSYLNLANPGTKDITAGVAPSWANGSGWTFNGTTHYLDTHTTFLTNSTLIIWYEDWSGVYVCGSTKVLIRPVLSGTTRLTINTNTDINGESNGGVIGVRAGLNAYRNNIQFGAMGSFPAGTDYNVYLGCRNNAGSAANFGAGKIYRIAMYDFKLSDAQMEAVISAMYNYQVPAADAYEAQVMALNPICYYPMTQKYGSALYDISGNNAPSQIKNLPVGQSAGNKGLSVAGDGTTGNFISTYADWDVRTGINMDNFSAACWIKVQSDASNQIRVWNVYSSSGLEYCAVEIRSGLQVSAYLKANGSTQNTTAQTIANNTWTHIVMYNNSSTNHYGYYINGVKYDFTRTVGPYNDTSPDFSFPTHQQDMLGNMQHIAYFDHALSQAEVDTLYP